MYDQSFAFVQANNSALVVFPGIVHCEPHEQISWAECQYVTDDYGGLFVSFFLSAWNNNVISMFIAWK